MNFLAQALKWAGSALYNSFFYDIGSLFATNAAVNVLKNLNSSLTNEQLNQLQTMIYRVFIQYREGREVKHMIAGICALALGLPYDRTTDIVTIIMSLFQSNADGSDTTTRGGRRRRARSLDLDDLDETCDLGDDDIITPRPRPTTTSTTSTASTTTSTTSTRPHHVPSMTIPSVPSTPTTHPVHPAHPARRSLAEVLTSTFNIQPSRVRNIPAALYPALIRTLRNPDRTTCVITMDDLVLPNPDGPEDTYRIRPDTVVLFQRSNEDDNGSNAGSASEHHHPKFQAYLFDKEALDGWFESSGSSTNPLTREDIDRDSQYFVLN